MHDLLIRNALLLDGLGSAPVGGDLGVSQGIISAVGKNLKDLQKKPSMQTAWR